MRSGDGTNVVASGDRYSFALTLLALGLVVACRDHGFDDCNSVAECVGAPIDGGAGQPSREWGVGGDGNDPLDVGEPSLRPTCHLYYEGAAVEALAGLAVVRTPTGSGAQLFSWDGPSSTAFYRVVPNDEVWVCFDLVPRVVRLAAMNLANAQPEVFALSDTGVLFVRRDSTHGWSPWLPFSLPGRSSLPTDVAAVGGKRARVYVADEGRVFVRTKVEETSYADYGAWQGLQENGALRLAAVERRDHGAQVVTLDRARAVRTAVMADGALEFGEWTSLAPLPQQGVELEAVDVGRLVIYALDSDGTVWVHVENAPKASWVVQPRSDSLGKVIGIAALPDGDTPQLFRIDANGNIDIVRGLP